MYLQNYLPWKFELGSTFIKFTYQKRAVTPLSYNIKINCPQNLVHYLKFVQNGLVLPRFSKFQIKKNPNNFLQNDRIFPQPYQLSCHKCIKDIGTWDTGIFLSFPYILTIGKQQENRKLVISGTEKTHLNIFKAMLSWILVWPCTYNLFFLQVVVRDSAKM